MAIGSGQRFFGPGAVRGPHRGPAAIAAAVTAVA